MTWDALLLVSFGGPEGPEDVLPFLRTVTAGRGIPDDRLEEVAAHYRLFGGVSPINGQNRALLAALRAELDLPVYWGNRNWAPYLTDALRAMRDDGVTRALAYVTSAYSSYSGCRQYREDVAKAQAAVEGAPAVDKLRVFHNHPAFVGCFVTAVDAARERLGVDRPRLVFTAHSIPLSMARTSAYEMQLRSTARLVAAACGDLDWELAWQSRSGPPQVPWLEPDVGDRLESLAAEGVAGVVVVPIGFVSDHMEVVFDLDTEAVPAARAAGLRVERATTPGDDPRIVAMVAELVAERTSGAERRALGDLPPSHDACPLDCCPVPRRR